MLTIRRAQQDVLADERRRELRDWLRPHLRRHFRARLSQVGDERLETLIAAGVVRARELGATTSPAICRFVHLVVLFGEDLETQPWTAPVLALPGLPGDVRIALLSVRARGELLARAGGAT